MHVGYLEDREEAPPRVFISYSHDSVAHGERVRELADRLRTDGVDAWIDRYSMPPSEGWPRWMEGQMSKADYVLLICTASYARRFSPEPGQGSGVTWEAELVRSEIHVRGQNKRFIPVLFEGSAPEDVPVPLLTYPRYLYPTEYGALLRHMSGIPEVVAPAIGTAPRSSPLPAFLPRSEGAQGPAPGPDAPALDEEKTVQAFTRTQHFTRNAGGEVTFVLLGTTVTVFLGGMFSVFFSGGMVWPPALAALLVVGLLYIGRRRHRRLVALLTEVCRRLTMSRVDAFRVFARPPGKTKVVLRVTLEGSLVQAQDLADILLPFDDIFGPSRVSTAGPQSLDIEKRGSRVTLFRWLLMVSQNVPERLTSARLVSTQIIER